MAWKNNRALITHALEELSQDNLNRLRVLLREPRGDGIRPDRFRVAQVEGKNCEELAHLLAQTFSKQAVSVTLAMLRAIDCNLAAEGLVEALEPGPKWGRSKTPPLLQSKSDDQQQAAPKSRTSPHQDISTSGAPAEVNHASAKKGHFVDRHRTELIERVCHISSILDHLLQEQVLQQEQYAQVMEIRSSQAQMRFLFSGPLKAGGDRSKDVLMDAICIQQPYLVEDLWKKESGSVDQ